MTPRGALLAIATTCFLAVASACSGGEEAGTRPGGADPEAVVSKALDAISDNDIDALGHTVDAAYTPGEAGLGELVQLARNGAEPRFEDFELDVQYDDDANEHARVIVNTNVVTQDGEAALTDRVLLTSLIEGRWYITSQNSEYWKAQLRPSPAQWAEMQADASTSLPGTFVPAHPGADGILLNGSRDDRAHIGNTTSLPICTPEQITANEISDPLCYHSNPPTSGPHAPSAAPFRVYTQPVEKEFLIHSMEHGGVIVWYNTTNQQAIQRLTALVETSLSRGLLVLLTPYPHMEAETIAVTSWTRIDKFSASQFDVLRVQRFIDAHERRFNPEGF